jgi:CBS domain-containing protein
MNINLKSNITRKLITIPADSQTEYALMVMKNHHFRHLPVVNEKNDIIGVVSDRDLYRGLSSDLVFVSDVMSKDVMKVDIKADVRFVVNSMITYKVSAFLVADQNETIGIITSEDLLSLLSQLLSENKNTPTLIEDFVNSFKDYTDAIKSPNYV